MLILRIRRAETALADGRLDEAFTIAQAPDLQAHYKGQKLIGRLARALADRAREHLTAGRLAQAGVDCEKAVRLGGSLPEIEQLRSALNLALAAHQRMERHRGDALAAARDHVANGRLSLGEGMLENAGDDSTRVLSLKDEVAGRRARVEAAVARTRDALDREDWAAAGVALAEARQCHPNDPRCCELAVLVARTVSQRAAIAVDAGRLDLAEAILQPVRRACAEAIEVRELGRFLDQCREAFASVTNGQPRLAAEIFRRLGTMRPGAAWIAPALQQAQQAAESLEGLRGGPLGLLDVRGRTSGVSDQTTLAATPAAPTRPHRSPEPAAPNGGLPGRLLFHVDGVGSFLVLRDRRVTIGAAGSSRRPEVGLLAESGMPAVTIERMEDDYFVTSEGGLKVNDAAVQRKLLGNGDRIALSPRACARFTLPNAASTSAVLHLAGTRMPGCDARQVVLLDRELIMGPGASAHVRADNLASPAVVHVRDGRIFCRAKDEVLVNDRPMDRQAGIPLGARVQVGSLSFVVTAA